MITIVTITFPLEGLPSYHYTCKQRPRQTPQAKCKASGSAPALVQRHTALLRHMDHSFPYLTQKSLRKIYKEAMSDTAVSICMYFFSFITSFNQSLLLTANIAFSAKHCLCT